MSNELVTAIITTHRRPINVLRRAIESVLHQTYTNIEIVVVNDDPSYEGNNEIVEYIKSLRNQHIYYFINDAKPGACASRNIGIKNSNGSIIALLDDDDAWHETKIEEMLPLFTKDVGLVFCDYDNIKNGEVVPRKKLPVYIDGAFDHLLYANFIGGCSVPIIKKECFDKSGLFDEEMPSCQDIDMWLRIVHDYKIAYIDKQLVHYYISDTSITSSYKRRVQGWIRLLKKFEKYFNKQKEAKKQWQKNIITVLMTYGEIKQAHTYYFDFYRNRDRIRNIKILLEGYIKRILFVVYGRRT